MKRLQTWTCPVSSLCSSGLPSSPSSCIILFILAFAGAIPLQGTLNGSLPPPTQVLTTAGDPDLGTSRVTFRALPRLIRRTLLPPRVGVLDSGLVLLSAR